MSDETHTDETETGQGTRRRRLLNWFAGLSVVAFFAGILTPLKDLALAVDTGTESEGGSGVVGQRLVYAHAHESSGGHSHEAGTIITADALQAPAGVQAFPENLTEDENYLLLLHNLEPEQLESPTNMDMTDQGFVAYSAICTHLGCTVSWSDDDHEVGLPHDHCPCHTGEFNPYRGAEPAGGPVTTPLPQIGVRVNDNNELELTSTFEEEGGE